MTPKRIIALMLFPLLFYVCNNSSEENLDDQNDNISVNKPSVYELKMKKINVVTNCLKGYSKSAFTAYQEYIGSFGNDAEHYRSKEVSNFTDVNAYNVQQLKLLEETLEIPVLEELNTLIRSYKINARAFSAAINSCERYYTAKGYKKDNFENGKGMHKPVIEIFERFSVVDSLLRVKSNKISENLELEYLDKLKRNGQEVEYLTIVGKKEASKINSLLTSASYDNLNVEKLKLLHDKINGIYEKLIVLKNSETGQFNTKNEVWYDTFEQFLKSVNELHLRKKEKKAFSKKEAKKLEENFIVASSVEGSPGKVIRTYNEFIKAYSKNLIHQ